MLAWVEDAGTTKCQPRLTFNSVRLTYASDSCVSDTRRGFIFTERLSYRTKSW